MNNLMLAEVKINKENNLFLHDKWFYICENDPNLYVCEGFCNSVERKGRFWHVGMIVSVGQILFKPRTYYQTLEGPYPTISSAAKKCAERLNDIQKLVFPVED